MSKPKSALHPNVLLTGFTSFFTDIASEMLYPLLQGFVAAVTTLQNALLGPVLGVIEGVAEATASLLKVFSGYWSDRLGKRKALAIGGYSLSTLSRLFYFIPSWYAIFLARFFDRVGKGIRTAPRDALISESVPRGEQGRAFGIQRGMDFAGAVLGSALCLFLLAEFFPQLRDMRLGGAIAPALFYPVFAVSLIPAFLAVVFLFFTKDAQKPAEKSRPRPNLHISSYHPVLRRFFLVQFLFTLGNSSNQFLLLRSMDLGFALFSVLGMYIIFNLATTLLSPFFGKLSDRIGRKRLLLAGYSLYAVVYTAFGLLSRGEPALLWVVWVVYGIYYALTEGVEKAFVADLADKGSLATALGFYHTATGIGLLPASLIAGFLYAWQPAAPFVFGGVMAVLTVVLLATLVKPARQASKARPPGQPVRPPRPPASPRSGR